jgi:hypothetical protein
MGRGSAHFSVGGDHWGMPAVPPLTEAQRRSLNEQFFEAQPWVYFQQRLAHLMLAKASPERYRDLLSEGVTAGGVTLTLETRANRRSFQRPSSPSSPSSRRSFCTTLPRRCCASFTP